MLKSFFIRDKLVLANIEMLRDATNLFHLKYAKRIVHHWSNAIKKFDHWYDRVKDKLLSENLNDFAAEVWVRKNHFHF